MRGFELRRTVVGIRIMPEHVGVIVNQQYERGARVIAQRLNPCFEVVFHVLGNTGGPGSIALSEIPKRRWVILAIPVRDYPIVVPALVRAMEPEKILIALNYDPYALPLLSRYLGNRPWIVLCPTRGAQVRWNLYPDFDVVEMEITLECIGRGLSSEQYKSLQERLANQTPGIAIKIVQPNGE